MSEDTSLLVGVPSYGDLDTSLERSEGSDADEGDELIQGTSSGPSLSIFCSVNGFDTCTSFQVLA